jgi:hypothetical protein
MRYLSIYKSVERGVPPSQEEMAKMGKLIEDGMKAAWLIATEGCLPTTLGARVRMSNGKLTVTDGPFTETNEVVGGFAILQASSKEEAIEGLPHSRWRRRVRASSALRGAAADSHPGHGQILATVSCDSRVQSRNFPCFRRSAYRKCKN